MKAPLTAIFGGISPQAPLVIASNFQPRTAGRFVSHNDRLARGGPSMEIAQMIAFSKPLKGKEKSQRDDDAIEQMLPAIQRHARIAFRALPISERDEMIAETVANAFCAY